MHSINENKNTKQYKRKSKKPSDSFGILFGTCYLKGTVHFRLINKKTESLWDQTNMIQLLSVSRKLNKSS